MIFTPIDNATNEDSRTWLVAGKRDANLGHMMIGQERCRKSCILTLRCMLEPDANFDRPRLSARMIVTERVAQWSGVQR